MVLLPSSPLSLCLDRFSLTDSDVDLVPSWSIICKVLYTLPTTCSNLVNQLETLAVTLRGTSDTDFSYLREFLTDSWDSHRFLAEIWPKCVAQAMEMPSLFPSGEIEPLTLQKHTRHEFTRPQLACLVIHQFLCTLNRPDWMQDDASPDFHIWYGSSQPHPKAVHAYLYALFTYFDQLASQLFVYPVTIDSPSVIFTLHSSPGVNVSIASSVTFAPITIHELPVSSVCVSLLGLPTGACVISANKYIGFGRTGTQEEMQLGSSPEACPVVLFSPPLSDAEVVIIKGAVAMIEMDGYGREAHLSGKITPSGLDWGQRTMLFMDALELDSYDTEDGALTPDLLPGNVDRELIKAFTAFSFKNAEQGTLAEVVTGLWGCGAFGGNAEIKTVIQWCAASITGVPLTFVCEADKIKFLQRIKTFSSRARKESWNVSEVVGILRTLHYRDPGSRGVLDYIEGVLGRS